MTANWPRASHATSREGALKVLSTCLQLGRGDSLALFYDESTESTAALLIDAATELGLDKRLRRVPLAEQAAFRPEASLSIEDSEALEQVRGVITLLSSSPEGTEYRKRLVQVGADGGRRMGHMPGADETVLAHALNIDYELARSRSDDLALAMTLGESAVLRSFVTTQTGDIIVQHDLHIPLGGLGRSPITSTGIIPLGTWGNLPGGETFIAPLEDTAEGVFVLNGAFKKFVFDDGDYLLLSLSRGRLTAIEGTGPGRTRLEQILELARQRGDENYGCLAELGVGLNPGISALTGNALFDEKCYGTAHIALGDSTRYGGTCESIIHEDLVTRGPSLWIDGSPILLRGAFAFDAAQWRDEIDAIRSEDAPGQPGLEVSRSEISADPSPEALRVRRQVTSGRVCEYTVGSKQSSPLLARVYARIPRLPLRIAARTLADEIAVPRAILDSAISCLRRHGLVTIRA
ncbi:MAG TPA: hypothetical protein VIX73_26610 [Kofleriaceae bacterium]|jgi:hypothetical protein